MPYNLSPHKPPTHPGQTLQDDYLAPMGLSMAGAARLLGLSQQLLNRIVRGETPVTVRTALRLEKMFGTDANAWLDLQRKWDMWHELKDSKRALARIKRLKPS